MNEAPAISIIIPVYNAELYLARCIDSVLDQDYQNWECILIDDGSTDNSAALCEEFALRDRRIRAVHKANGGVSSARNAGIELARGEWICFTDSDDRLATGALSYMLELNTSTGADVSLCTIVKKNELPAETKALDQQEQERLIWACLAYRTDVYAKKGFLIDAPHGKLFRASIIKNQGLKFVDGLCKSEDALFDAEFYLHSARIVMDTRQVYHYTVNPDSICHTYKFENIPMFGILLRHEQEFVNKWYAESPEFKYLLNIRAFVALEQVMYEAGAEQLTYTERARALRMFMNSELISDILKSTEYSQIAAYMTGRSKKVDLFLIKRRMFTVLCLWADMCKRMFQLRVSAVRNIKKLFGLDSGYSLSSLLSRS